MKKSKVLSPIRRSTARPFNFLDDDRVDRLTKGFTEAKLKELSLDIGVKKWHKIRQ